MEQKNNPINQNPGNNNVENNASSSGTNPTISEAEKEQKAAEFKAKFSELWDKYLEDKITKEEHTNEVNNLFQFYQLYFTKEELVRIKNQPLVEKKKSVYFHNISDLIASSEILRKKQQGEELTEEETDSEEDSSEGEFWTEEEIKETLEQQQKIKELEKTSERIEDLAIRQAQQLQILADRDKEIEQKTQEQEKFEHQLDLVIKNKSVSVNNNEIIKAEISQELTAIKESFENIKISEISEDRINHKINKEVDRLKNSWDNKNLGWGIFSMIPIAGNIAGPIHAAKHSEKLEEFLKKQVKKDFPEIVKKLVNEATVDFEKQKNQALKRLDIVLASRNKEIELAQRAILQMEDIINGLKIANEKELENFEREKIKLQQINQDLAEKSEAEIKDLKNLSEEEINKLQGSIKELNNRLKEIQQKELNLKKQREEQLKNWTSNQKAEKTSPKAIMKSEAEKIQELEKQLDETIFTANVFKESESQRALELEHAKNELEREKKFLNSKLEKETEFLKGEIARKEALIERIKQDAEKDLEAEKEKHEFTKQTWQKHYNLEKETKEQVQNQLAEFLKKRAEEVDESRELAAKVKNLKIDKSTLSNKITELEETIKGLQPSYAYTIAEKLGFIKLKGWLVNTAVIFAIIVILYLLSVFLKYIAKPTWLNFAAFFPKSKKRKVITVEAEEQEEEEEPEEEIFEVKAKPKLTKKPKVLRSNTKTKPKSKTK